jgi:hypothetical protein
MASLLRKWISLAKLNRYALVPDVTEKGLLQCRLSAIADTRPDRGTPSQAATAVQTSPLDVPQNDRLAARSRSTHSVTSRAMATEQSASPPASPSTIAKVIST